MNKNLRKNFILLARKKFWFSRWRTHTYVFNICSRDVTSFVSRLRRNSTLARKITMEERGGEVCISHRDFPSVSISFFLSSFSFALSAMRILLAPGYVSVATPLQCFHLVLRRPEAESSSTSRGRQVCRRHYSLPLPLSSTALPQRSPYNIPLSAYSISSTSTTTTTTTTITTTTFSISPSSSSSSSSS